MSKRKHTRADGSVVQFREDGTIENNLPSSAARAGIQPGTEGLESSVFVAAAPEAPGATTPVKEAYAKFAAADRAETTLGRLNGFDVTSHTIRRGDGSTGVVVTWVDYRGNARTETVYRDHGGYDEEKANAAIEEWKSKPPMGADTRSRFRKILDEVSWLSGKD